MTFPRCLAVIALLAGLVAAGCNGSPRSTAGTGTTAVTAAPTSAPTETSSTVAGGTTTTQKPNTTSSTTPAVTACATNMLTATLGNGNGAAGTIFYHLVFSNHSTRNCTVQGYPGVSFVDGTGHQIGAPVPRDTTSTLGGLITLGPGSSAGAVFALHDAYVGSGNGCMPTSATGLRVYPPNQTAALFVSSTFQVCANAANPGSASITAVTNLANLPG